MKRYYLAVGALVVMAGSINAQTFQRRAILMNTNNPQRGKCTIEVVVDGSAEVEIRGDNAVLRNTGGQAPQWRRFECTGPMPANAPNFRFAGVDGRGRQTLIRDPRNGGGTAVVRIEDPPSGAEGYVFDLFWENGGGGGPITDGRYQDGRPQDGRYQDGRPQDGRPPDDRYRDDRNRDGRGVDRGGFGGGRRFTENEAVRVCQDAIRDQAADRFRTRDIDFRRVGIDDNPGRNDWVVGELAIHRRFGRDDLYRFSCSVNFDTGQVRTARIDQFDRSNYPNGR
jgi:hypothetical protein